MPLLIIRHSAAALCNVGRHGHNSPTNLACQPKFFFIGKVFKDFVNILNQFASILVCVKFFKSKCFHNAKLLIFFGL